MRYKWIEITTKIGCSNNCKYCPQKLLLKRYFENNRQNPVYLTLENFKKILSHIPQDLEICFAGFSEPFENPDAVKMLRLAFQAGHDVSLYTTLRGLNISDIPEIAEIPFINCVIHLPDGDDLMSFPINDEYLQKLDLLQSLKISNLSYMCIGTPHNALLPHICQEINILTPTTRSNNVDCGQCQKLEFLPLPEIKYPIICNRRLLLQNKKFYSPSYTEMMVALPNGDLTLCCMDYGLEHILGNILHSPYKKIFHSKEMKRIRKIMAGKIKGNIICHRCTDRIAFPKWRCFFLYWTGHYNNIPVLNPIKRFLTSLIRKRNTK